VPGFQAQTSPRRNNFAVAARSPFLL